MLGLLLCSATCSEFGFRSSEQKPDPGDLRDGPFWQARNASIPLINQKTYLATPLQLDRKAPQDLGKLYRHRLVKHLAHADLLYCLEIIDSIHVVRFCGWGLVQD